MADADRRFAHRLALATGRTDVDGMLRGMTLTQFQDWQEFDEIEPIGGKRGDWQAASIVSALYSLQRNVKLYPEPFPPSTFLLEYGPERRPVARAKPFDWQGAKNLIGGYVAAINADEERMRSRGRRS